MTEVGLAEGGQTSLFPQAAEPQVAPADLVSLVGIRGLGFQGIRSLVQQFGRLEAVWEAPEGDIEAALRAAKVAEAGSIAQMIGSDAEKLRARGKTELERLAENLITVVTCSDPLFPERLRIVQPAIYWLFIEGSPQALKSEDIVAVVGTRKPSREGRTAATILASWLVRRNITIVSGLAEGIDAAAQQVAVDADQATIAVLGHGLSVVFPASTARLRQDIARAGGAVISEYLPAERYDRKKFVARNRIQAALSKVLVPVEADYESGTARSVRFAQDYGRTLVGVKVNGETGIHRLLTELGAPIIDLLNPAANGAFALLLSDAFQRVVPTEPPAASNQMLNRFVGEFRDLIARYRISEEDLERLIEQLRAVHKESRPRNGD